MDIVSHGLWGGAAFGKRNNGKSFWLAFLFGVAPDLFSFGIFTAGVWLRITSGPDWSNGMPDQNLIPAFVHTLYNFTHSLVVFSFLFAAVWIVLKKPLWELAAWGLHILVDIPTHSSRFFPTPFLWPFSDFEFNGWHWGSPWVWYPNIVLLILVYAWFYARKRKNF